MKILSKDPAELRLHPLHRHLPETPKDSPEWHSFVDGMSGAGCEGTPPIIITPSGFIMDGGRRWQGAKQLQWKEIYCVEQPEDQAALIIVESLFGQRSISRGAKVYLALGVMKEFVAAAEVRRIQNLKRGIKTLENPLKVPKDSNCPSETIQELCDRWGVHINTYKNARRVRDLFDKSEELRAQWEPALLSGEKNLWNVISGIEGRAGDQSTRESAKAASQLELFDQSLTTLGTAGKFWSRFDAEKREQLIEKARGVVANMPQELCRAIAEAAQERFTAETQRRGGGK